MAERYVTPREIERLTGIHHSIIEHRINHYRNGVDPSSVTYNDKTGNIMAKSPGGQNLQFYVIQTSGGQSGYFGGKRDVQYLVDNAGGEAYPDLADGNVIIDF